MDNEPTKYIFIIWREREKKNGRKGWLLTILCFTIWFWGILGKLTIWWSMRTVWYWKAPRILLSILWEHSLRSNAIFSIRAGCNPISLHCLEIVGWAGHVFQVWQRLQGFNNFTHHGSSFWIPTKAPSSQLCSFLGTFYGKMTLKPRIYQPIKPSFFTKMWPCPFHQVMFPIRPVLVHWSSTCDHFKKNYTKTVDITLWCQMSWGANKRKRENFNQDKVLATR